MGEYESVQQRERRFASLVIGLKNIRPDIIAIQEANPVKEFAQRLADSLGFDYIYQRANGGIKIMNCGIPTNLNEGIAFLAQKDLHLEYHTTWDLSDGFGLYGNIVSFHFNDRNAALVGKIQIEGKEIVLINTHLIANGVGDSLSETFIRKYFESRRLSSEQIENKLTVLREMSNIRKKQANVLLENISKEFYDKPVILLGDFNASPATIEIKMIKEESQYIDLFDGNLGATWDPEKNTNIKYSLDTVDAS
ncbi:MAG: hypothetical protein PHP42_14135, partial [Bacteroidota bacterium]|nr:hypothetical protein [Bacteroidota bacterium]